MAPVRFSTMSHATLFDMDAVQNSFPSTTTHGETTKVTGLNISSRLSSPRASISFAEDAYPEFSKATGVDNTYQNEDPHGEACPDLAEDDPRLQTALNRSRSDSLGTLSSIESASVDWAELDRSEEQAPRGSDSHESTTLLLARLEQENNALAIDPKAKLTRSRSVRKDGKARPASVQYLQRLVNEPTPSPLRYSIAPEPPAMTELEFWAALVNDYPQTAQRLPTITARKIRAGVPPPLRGVVWMSIAGSRDPILEDQFDRLLGESSPYEGLIGKDVGRSFPAVEMFRDPKGDGQRMLANVLNCFSLHDEKIGYCQGLGFVVGPLLMHMGDKEAFGVLVRLMDHYDLRSCFLPNLSGLHLRIFQFQQLLTRYHAALAAHLADIGVEPLYVSQWFLSFFAITCPLPMLLRIYDVILTEGASETLMRVALSLMRRNETRLMACAELEDAMTLLLGRSLWDTYSSNADELVDDFVGLTGAVTRESLEALEKAHKAAAISGGADDKHDAAANVQNAAARFIGRFWSGNTSSPIGSPAKATAQEYADIDHRRSSCSRPTSFLSRSTSKQSLVSSDSSDNGTDHRMSASTDATTLSKQSSAGNTKSSSISLNSQDRDLHVQIEELLTALSNLQRENNALARELQREREDRDDDQKAVQMFIAHSHGEIPCAEENKTEIRLDVEERPPDAYAGFQELKLRFSHNPSGKRSSLVQQTKQQMREEIVLWRQQYEVEAGRSADLTAQVCEHQKAAADSVMQTAALRKDLEDSRSDAIKLAQMIADLKVRRYSTESDFEPCSPTTPTTSSSGLFSNFPSPFGNAAVVGPAANASGKQRTRSKSITVDGVLATPQTPRMPPSLIIPETPPSTTDASIVRSASGSETPIASSTPFSARSSSLGISKVLSTQDHRPPSEEALLVELVNVKTSEATARHELEVAKAKLESLRRMVGVPSSEGASPMAELPSLKQPRSITSLFAPSGASGGHTRSVSAITIPHNSLDDHAPKLSPSTSSGSVLSTVSAGTGSFFSGWGKRAPSVAAAPPTSLTVPTPS